METEVCIEIQQGCKRSYNADIYILRLKQSMYRLNQSNYSFYKKLSSTLELRKIIPCSTDSCIYVLKNLILIIYADEILIFNKKKVWIDILIKFLFKGSRKFELTDEEDIDKYLGINMQKHKNSIHKLK